MVEKAETVTSVDKTDHRGQREKDLSLQAKREGGRSQIAMAEKDLSPLSVQIVRGLNDKLYEKRKTAALEIER